MDMNLKEQLRDFFGETLKKAFFQDEAMPDVEIEEPSEKKHGDLSTNIAMKSARVLRQSPMAIAPAMRQALEAALPGHPLAPYIEAISVEPPGFINVRLSSHALLHVLTDVLARRDDFGRQGIGVGTRVQIEFVSANPTGPLSVAHARQAVVGDVLANILNFLGFETKREYYVNDGGNQITMLGKSIRLRALEVLGETVDFPDECYQGDYIRDMARVFMERHTITGPEGIRGCPDEAFKRFGAEYLMDVIREELKDFGVHFDIWSYESEVANRDNIQRVLDALTAKGFTYEEGGALWFRSTAFGDDKDRVVRKSDGSFTYLAPDIAYHQNKYERGFQKVYNIWGPDHHGYIPRIRAAVQALGYDVEALTVLIVQLATIYRNGQPVSMSTRKGEFISLREVLTEVGRDAARFFFLMRGISAHLDFDLELAKKETPENPVYYIQYAHARIHSIVAKAAANGLTARQNDFRLLGAEEEWDLIKKIGAFGEILLACQRQMDAFLLVSYLQELAACFHRFYDQHRVVDLAQPDVSAERLGLIEAARIVLANGLSLLGVSRPEQM